MYELIIKEYINKLNINNIKKYAYNNNISLNDNETNYLYNFIKNNWRELYRKKDITILYELKNNINIDAYNHIITLFNKYKNKY